MPVKDLYQKVIIDHNRHPRNSGELQGDYLAAERHNPVCGDQVKLMLKIDSAGQLHEVAFCAKGCAICSASASILTELISGKNIREIQVISRQVFEIFQQKRPFEQLDLLGDLSALKGVLQYPVRIKCVLLAWHALEDALPQ